MAPNDQLQYHDDPAQFREALTFTESGTGFSARLVEKDYYCSLVLHGLAAAFQQGLIFKGGTCLSKVHADFYRLSEDLDFVISMDTVASRGVCRNRIAPIKDLFANLATQLPCFQVAKALTGSNNSKQYIGGLSYTSLVTGQHERLTVEVGLREPVLSATEPRLAHTLLIDPLRRRPVLQPISVVVLSFHETYAEKLRAALTRRDPAIRDYYDIHHAVTANSLNLSDSTLITLLRHKLAVPGNLPVDVSHTRFTALQRQLESQLKPVLRTADFARFDLERIFAMVAQLAARL